MKRYTVRMEDRRGTSFVAPFACVIWRAGESDAWGVAASFSPEAALAKALHHTRYRIIERRVPLDTTHETMAHDTCSADSERKVG